MLLAGYIVYDKTIFQRKSDSEEIKDEIKEENLALDSDLVRALEEKFDVLNEQSCAYGWERILNLYENNSFLMSNYNYSIKLASAIDYVDFDNEYLYRSLLTEEAVNELKNSYFSLFGFDENFKFENISETCPVIENNNGSIFIDASSCGCGGAGYVLDPKMITTKVLKSEENIKIYKKIGFYLHLGLDESERIVFTSDTKGNAVIEDLKNVEIDNYDFEGYIKNNLDKFDTYIITYKKDVKDNYYLYSIEKDI